jgi:hypothetical protein
MAGILVSGRRRGGVMTSVHQFESHPFAGISMRFPAIQPYNDQSGAMTFPQDVFDGHVLAVHSTVRNSNLIVSAQ